MCLKLNTIFLHVTREGGAKELWLRISYAELQMQKQRFWGFCQNSVLVCEKSQKKHI